MNNTLSPAATKLQIQVADDCDDAPSSEDLQEALQGSGVALAQVLPPNLAAALSKELCVRLCDEGESKQLNHDYRGREKSTNVLSFGGMADEQTLAPLPSDARNQNLPELPLGDLAICWPVVQAEAQEQGKPVEHHLQHLFMHGVLHLLGFDHETPEEAEAMERIECEALALLSIPNPYLSVAANA